MGLVFTSVLVIILTTFSSAAYFLQVPVIGQLYSNLAAPLVQGGIDLNNPGGESFWNGITGADIVLAPSISYQSALNELNQSVLIGYGGMVSSIKVKMAMNQTHVLVYATWSDPTESRSGNPVCFGNDILGNRACLEDESFPGLFYANSTYSYEDRLVFWWNLDATPGPAPCMTETPAGTFRGEGESLAGTGNLWHWKAGRTDSLGAKYGKLKYGGGPGTFGVGGPNQGQIINPTHSYSANEFINTTGHYVLGWDQYPTVANPGNFTIGFADTIHQTYDTFMVAAHGVWSNSNGVGTWKWVAARPLTTFPTLHIVQFQPGQTYNFAVGVYDGGPIPIPAGLPHPSTLDNSATKGPVPWTMYGENEETKSISSWYTATLGTTGGTTGTGPYTFGSFETAALVSLGMLVVGFVAGVVVITRFAMPKKPKA
jgi:hypothetical protein